ncbi:hypothetical protein O4H61_04005 [Roseovarius aestuarii]|nr:hypothetical protein [Roseovarius aestuarii]
MSALRDEIRAILRDEIAALRSEITPQRMPEQVHIRTSADLDRFARDLVMRAQSDSGFAAAVASGAQCFELSGAISAPAVTYPQRPVASQSAAPRDKAEEFTKRLVTERDIEGLEQSVKMLRVPKNCRLTPLANDEARRRGIRIERLAT